MEIRTTKKGIEFLKEVEGLRLKAYDDGGGVRTIGYGHTKGDFPDEITKEQAEEYLIEDIKDAEEPIEQHVTVPLRTYQFDALVSFVFNLGSEQFRKSTLLRLLNNGMYDEVPKQMMRWVYDNKKKIYGLEVRRSKEARMFKGEL